MLRNERDTHILPTHTLCIWMNDFWHNLGRFEKCCLLSHTAIYACINSYWRADKMRYDKMSRRFVWRRYNGCSSMTNSLGVDNISQQTSNMAADCRLPTGCDNDVMHHRAESRSAIFDDGIIIIISVTPDLISPSVLYFPSIRHCV